LPLAETALQRHFGEQQLIFSSPVPSAGNDRHRGRRPHRACARGNARACEESLLNKLLNEMDGLREDAAVLFVLTTNRPRHLEAALAARPGRIDQAIEFPLPDERGRLQAGTAVCRGLPLSDDVAEVIARKTKGASAAFIKEFDAPRRAVLSRGLQPGQSDSR